MRLAHAFAIALLSGCGAVAAGVLADPVVAQSGDEDDDEAADNDGDDDAEVPDPDDESSDPGDGDAGGDDPGDPGDEEPIDEEIIDEEVIDEEPVDEAPDDEGSGDTGSDDGTGGDDDGAGSGGDDGDDGAGSGGDDDGDDGAGSGGGGDDDGDDGAGSGGGGDDDGDDGAGSGGGGTGGDDDGDDGAGAGGGSPTGDGGDADDDGDDDDGPASGGNDDAGEPADDQQEDDDTPTEYVGDEEIIGGGDESESERVARDEVDGIETDREGFRYRSHEFVALDLDAEDLSQLQADGFELVRSDNLGELGRSVHLLRGPARISDADALTQLEEVADPGSLSFNHLFDSSSARVRRTAATAPPERAACGCTIGLIDSGVANTLASFRHVTIEQRAFNGTRTAARLHGTAVAHLFAGTRALAGQRTRIFVGDIFSGDRATSGSTYALVRALDWMAQQQVPVINVSLAGPRNNVVAQTVARLAERGHVIVAAAGNDGPAAPPVFPGAYRNVVAVTAVDGRNRIYRYANRGTYIDFAARGVDVAAIDADGDSTLATGTSFAAPIVAARLAADLRTVDPQAARRAINALQAEVTDLGDPGRDPTYGDGLVAETP